jgi:hypothetical protein
VTGQQDDHDLRRPSIDPAELRQRLATLAAAIASTEDSVADTLERLALVRPYDAAGLQARAAQARRCAAQVRDQAVRFSLPR